MICAIFLGHVWLYDFVSDDTFISLRYSKNLAEGNGLVFNPGERVEGFTSPLWVFLLAGMRVIGCDLLWSARFLGVVAGLVTLILTWKLGVVAEERRGSPLMRTVPALILAANGSFACWAGSGMETSLYVCLVVGSLLAVSSGSYWRSAILVIALILARPEGMALFVVIAVYQAYQRPRIGNARLLVWLGACLASAAALFVSRHLYYGEWLPNTYFAKVGGGGLESIGRGAYYLAQYAGDHEGLAFLAAPIVYGSLRGSARLRLLASAAAVLWAGVVWEGGDGLPMYRFALAPLPLLAVLGTSLICAAGDTLTSLSVKPWKIRVTRVSAVLFLAALHATRPVFGAHYIRYEYQKRVEVPRWTLAGKWLRENGRRGESIAAGPIGAVSYYSELKAIDMLGLTDRHIAHRKMERRGSWAGHEKHDGAYVLRRRPTYLLLGNVDVTEQPRDVRERPFITYSNSAIWDREADLYETDFIETAYVPRSVLIGPGLFLNFYELREKPE